MGSKLVVDVIAVASRPLSRTIRTGKPVATMLGGFCGLAAGIVGGLCTGIPVVATALAGVILGAFAAALFFKRRRDRTGARETDREPFRLGQVRQFWTCEFEEFRSLTVLLDNAIYTVREENGPWDDIIRQLARGEIPNLTFGELIRLDELTALEGPFPDSAGLELLYRTPWEPRRRWLNFTDVAERDEFVAALERHYGTAFHRGEMPTETFRAIRVPLVLALCTVVAFGGFAWLSAHWLAHPPPPPLGHAGPAPIVELFNWLGPLGFLGVGALPLFGWSAWLCSRLMSPPWVPVLSRRSEGLHQV